MALQIRRGTEAERTAGGGVVFAEGELIYVTDTDGLFIGDGSTAGGVKLTDNAGAVLGTYITADTINSTLDLQQNLDLNGKDIVGTGNINIDGTITATGNINIGDDADSDTVDFTAKITSSLTPSADSTHNIGAMNARWNNGYFTGLWVDGQINAVSLNGDVLANDSTLLVNATNGKIVGDVVNSRVTTEIVDAPTDDLYVLAVNDGSLYLGTTNTRTVTIGASNTTVYVNGDQDSIIAGGQFLGDLKGSVFGDDSTLIIDAVANTLNGNLTGNVTGALTGDVTGDLTGQVKGSSGTNVLSPNTGPADAELSVLNVTATGTISGNVTGNLTGNVVGNTTGYHIGDVKGSVFADDSTLLVDAVAGTIPGGNITGTITADLTGNVTGNVVGDVTGDLTGNIFTNLIDSSDSSAIVITPAVTLSSDLQVENDINVSNNLNITGNLQVDNISSFGNVGGTIYITSPIEADNELVVDGILSARNQLRVNQEIRYGIQTGVDGGGEPTFAIGMQVTDTKADFPTLPVKFPNFTQAEIDALDNEVGMVVFNTTNAKLEVCTGAGTGGAQTYVALH